MIDTSRAYDTLQLAAGIYNLSNGLVLDQSDSSLTIRGAGIGSTVLKLASTVDFGIEIRSGVVGLTIEHLTIEGTLPFAQGAWAHGIGSRDGQVNVNNITIQDIEARHLKVGVSVGATRTGSYEWVTIRRNLVWNILGTESGTGYGIHNDAARHVTISDNEIRDAERHAIYQARTNGFGDVLIDHNLLLRSVSPATHVYSAALAIARSQGVTAANNVIIATSYPHPSLSIDFDDGNDGMFQITSHIYVIGNWFLGDRWSSVFASEPGPHTWWGNVVRPQSDNTHSLCTYSYHTVGAEVDCDSVGALASPAAWDNTQAMARAGDGLLYIMQNDTLRSLAPQYGVDPNTWASGAYSTTLWTPQFQALATMNDGYVYVMQYNTLHRVTPGASGTAWTLEYATYEWYPFQAMAALDGFVYSISGPDAGNHMNKITPGPTGQWQRTVDQTGWYSTQGMISWGGYLYVMQYDCQHRVDANMQYAAIGGPCYTP